MWTPAIVASGFALPLVLLGAAPAPAIDGRAWKDLPEPARAYDIVGAVDAWANVKGASDQAILDLVDRSMSDHPGQGSTGMSGLIWNALNGFCGDH